MNEPRHYLEAACPACGAAEVCDSGRMIALLREIGKLSARSMAEPDIVAELFRVSSAQLKCLACGRLGLTVGTPREDQDDWPEARQCAACGKPIPPERLEALPTATFCAACQQADERGELPEEAEYCPRCGSLLALRPKHIGGATRYVLVCTGNPPCRLGSRGF